MTTCQELSIVFKILHLVEKHPMKAIQIGQLKRNFSEILQQIQATGEKFVIEYGRKHKKIAIIIPYDQSYEKQGNRQFGLYHKKGSFKLKNDFEMTEEEFLDL